MPFRSTLYLAGMRLRVPLGPTSSANIPLFAFAHLQIQFFLGRRGGGTTIQKGWTAPPNGFKAPEG